MASFHVRPIPFELRSLKHPPQYLRVVILRDRREVTQRSMMFEGVRKLHDSIWVAAFWRDAVEADPDRFWKLNRVHRVYGELCFSVHSFCPSVVAHEALHCVQHLRRVGWLARVQDGWKETDALALESIVRVVLARGEAVRRRVLRSGRA